MDNWLVALAIIVGLYWVASAITTASEEMTERLDQFLDD
jgi:hypothetical protein